jgi:5-methylcytosine-specific restriction endonuclease McrBC regulatory subunit McrC
MPSEIVVRERSSLQLEPTQYRLLEECADTWKLRSAGVIELQRTGRHAQAIRAGNFVGHAILGEQVLVIDEKIRGALAGLLSASSNVDGKLIDVPAGVDSHSDLIHFFVARFVELLSAYVSAGRERRYVRRIEHTSIPRGKILLSESIRLAAVGRADRVVVARSDLSANTDVNRLLALGLRAADRILSGHGSSSSLSRVRAMAMLFEDADIQRLQRYSFALLDQEFSRVLAAESGGPRKAALQLSRILALHFGLSVRAEDTAPFTWLVNLESLFEQATRAALAASAPEYDLLVSDWRSTHEYLLNEERYRAEPDIVFRSQNRACAIADTKYKSLDGSPQHDDIYQLLAHADAYDVPLAMLIYPGEKFSEQALGESPSGKLITVVEIRPTHLTGDARTLLAGARRALSGL